MDATTIAKLEGRLLGPAAPGRFDPAELEGLPEPVRRHLTQAIAPGTPFHTSARLRMRGSIRVGRWLPFRAHQVLSPHQGFVWSARAAGVIAGTDRYADGAGAVAWRLAGLVTVAAGEGPDVSRWSCTCAWTGPGGSPRWRSTAGATPTATAASAGTPSGARSPATAASAG